MKGRSAPHLPLSRADGPAYVSNRAPASLLVGQSRTVFNDTLSDDLPAFNKKMIEVFAEGRYQTKYAA